MARHESEYPKAFRVGYLEQTMDEATGCLNVLAECLEKYPEQIARCDSRTRELFKEALWRAARPV